MLTLSCRRRHLPLSDDFRVGRLCIASFLVPLGSKRAYNRQLTTNSRKIEALYVIYRDTFNMPGVSGVNLYSMLVAVVGAVVVLFVYHAVIRRCA